MKNYQILWLSFVVTICVSSHVFSQPLENKIYKPDIKTAIIHKKGWELAYPVININSGEQVELSFDELNKNQEAKNYHYTIIHCNSDWTVSDLFPSDYIDGFTESDINNYDYSFNTLVKYVHYTVSLPNENMRILIPGNYVIKVYENYNPDDTVLTKRFFVIDQKVAIKGRVTRARVPQLMNSHQEVNFTLRTNFHVNDPFQDLKVVIVKNNVWQNANTGLKPGFIGSGELRYDYREENTFAGGNEYRQFETKNLHYPAMETDSIFYTEPYHHFVLKPDNIRAYSPYQFQKDLNGRFLVVGQEIENNRLETDYVYVHFSLPYEIPNAYGDLYVFGNLTDNRLRKEAKLTYDYQSKTYRTKLLLKQGYYNYQYVFVEKNSPDIDFSYIEGNYYETENDYMIFIYYRDRSVRYDELVGFKVFNSVKKL